MIRSVVRAIDIMQVFSTSEPHLTLGEISSPLEFAESTAFNLLNTLVACGSNEKTDDDRVRRTSG
jgi:DNA-binding IclR family transcriptional regulator